MSSVINALKRLERAGSEDSRQTEKLLEAARALSAHIARYVIAGAPLPRGYKIDVTGNPTLIGYDDYNVDAGREQALLFASDIADGWLDELADWLETHSSESTEAIRNLERAAEVIKQAAPLCDDL